MRRIFQRFANGRAEKLPGSSPEVWYTWTNRQLSLTQGSLSAAMAYDFCYDAWDPTYRAEISLELYNQAEPADERIRNRLKRRQGQQLVGDSLLRGRDRLPGQRRTGRGGSDWSASPAGYGTSKNVPLDQALAKV